MKLDKQYLLLIILIIIGMIITVITLISGSNLIYKNNDFTKTISFDSTLIEGDSGYITIERNKFTPSIADNVKFSNGKNHILFSSEKIEEKLYFTLPGLESGTYYVDIKIVFVSGKEEIKEIKFKII